MNDLKLALAAGAVHFPRMHFVIAQALAMEQVDVRLFTTAAANGQLAALPVHENLNWLPLPHDVRRRTYPVVPWSLERRLKQWRPDVVNLHFLALGGWAADAAASLGVPLVTTVHALEPFLSRESTGLRGRYIVERTRRALDGTTMFLAVSDYIARWLRDLGVEDARIRTQYLGIDTEFWSSHTAPEARHAARSVLFVGHLSDLKGVSDLVAASLRVQRDHVHELHLIGDGPLSETLGRTSRQHPHIHLHGVRSRAEIRGHLERATVLVLPTRPRDGIEDAAPTVLMEAQSMGVPVVACRAGGTPEMVAHSDAIVPPEDLDALSDALVWWLQIDESSHRERCEQVRAWTVEHRGLVRCSAEARDSLAQLVG